MASINRKTLAAVVGAPAALILMTFVPKVEGDRLDPYLDIVKVPTECYGHAGADVVMGHRQTEAQCRALLDTDLLRHAEPVVACTPQVKASPYFTAAAISLAYNIGTTAYCRSSVADAFRRGDPRQACANFFNFLKPAALRGRRAQERALCERGL